MTYSAIRVATVSTERLMLHVPILGEQDDNDESCHEVNEASNDDLGVVFSNHKLLF